MSKLKTINIKGKEYVEVHERLRYFRDNFPEHSLISEVIEKTENSILIMAYIIDADDNTIATGLAEEQRGSSFINKTSYVENCETSAWGRALANFGIGLGTSVASADEVANAIENQKSTKTKLTKSSKNWGKVSEYVQQHKKWKTDFDKMIANIKTKYDLPVPTVTAIKKIYEESNSN